MLRIPAAHLAALRCLRLAIPPLRPVRSRRLGRTVGGTGSWYSGSRAGNVSGDGRTSQVPEQPSCPRALFLDPGRTDARQGHDGVSARPPLVTTTVAPTMEVFGAQSHGIGTHCLRFAARVTPRPRKTRFRLLARLYRAGFVNPQGCVERFQSSSLIPLSRVNLALCPLFPDPSRATTVTRV